MEKKAIRVAYGEAIVKLGAENDKVVVLDADLAAATMTNGFKKAYPDRFIDCGMGCRQLNSEVMGHCRILELSDPTVAGATTESDNSGLVRRGRS